MEQCSKNGVLIQAVSTVESNREWSGSGFIMNEIPNGFMILTSASWMIDILYISDGVKDGQPVLHPLENISFYVFLNTEIKSGIKSEIQKFKAKVHNIYYMNDVYSTLHELERSSLNQWTCVKGESKEHKDDPFIHLSRAVVFTIECRDYKMLSMHNFTNVQDISLGEELYIINTPFGSSYPKVFLNSISIGCLSNVYGHEGEVFMTDARCVIGCEGGMVTVKDRRDYRIVGMILAFLSNDKGLSVGATLACSIASIKRATKNIYSNWSSIGSPSVQLKHYETVNDDVVAVHFGDLYGSGIILCSDLVLTCGHVVKQYSKGSIRRKSRDIIAHVLCTTTCPDIAILQLSERINKFNDLFNQHQDNECTVGDSVLAIGYTYQHPFKSCFVSPTVTRGIISKVVPLTEPVMLQTTTSVHHGMSGGLLCYVRTGKPIGMLSCVARDDSLSLTHSNIAFVIPFSWIKHSVLQFIATRDPLVFSYLGNSENSHLWNLADHCAPMESKL